MDDIENKDTVPETVAPEAEATVEEATESEAPAGIAADEAVAPSEEADVDPK